MARWDEILTLPVQNPPTPEFSSAEIVWSRVEGWQDGVDRVALIPFSRVNDFVRGESNMKECPTRFHVEARRKRPPEMPYKPKVDGILEYILYWCSFGPDDHRKGGVVRPSRNYTAKRKTPAGRPSTKRGCVCHFIVKRLIAEPTVALIIYNFEKHVDKQGLPCHGPQDKMAVGTRAMFAPYISEEMRLQVMSLLYVGIPVETIMQRHTESVEKQGGPCNRDDLLTHRYVRRLERKIRRSTYELDPDDAASISLWIETHQADVFFYKDYSETEPFVLGIQTEWQLQQMIRFGNRSLLASDSRFGTNKLKYPVQSLLVFDQKNNAIPVAWIITPQFAISSTHRWLRALYDRVYSKDPRWRLGGFIVDDPSSDVHMIREVFQCSVLISFWRVRHAWHKNLMKRCTEKEIRIEISRRLGKILSCICRESRDADAFDDFLEDFVDCSSFMDYFKATWFPRLGTWTDALKTLSLASAETSATIECYHYQMKLRLLNEKDPSVYQRADWLVHKLGTKVHSYYWLDEYAEKDSFARYWKDEWRSGFTSCQQSLQIPDMDVVVGTEYAKVVSNKKQGKVNTVWNPGSEFAICECSWSRMGNLCKHVIKVSKIYRDTGTTAPSISLFEYKRTLNNILCCPPHDSLIRDHSIALAISVQMQLNALSDLKNAQTYPSASVSNNPTGAEGLPTCNRTESSDNDNDQMSSVNISGDAAGTAVVDNVGNCETHCVQSELTDKDKNNLTNKSFCKNVDNCDSGKKSTSTEMDGDSHYVQISPTLSESIGREKVGNNAVTGEFSENRDTVVSNDREVLRADDCALDAGGGSLAALLEGRLDAVVLSTSNNVTSHDTVNVSSPEKVMDVDLEYTRSSTTASKSVTPDKIGGEQCNLQHPLNLPCHQVRNDLVEHQFDSMVVDAVEKTKDKTGNNSIIMNETLDNGSKHSAENTTLGQEINIETGGQITEAAAVNPVGSANCSEGTNITVMDVHSGADEVEVPRSTFINGPAADFEVHPSGPDTGACDSNCVEAGAYTEVLLDVCRSAADVVEELETKSHSISMDVEPIVVVDAGKESDMKSHSDSMDVDFSATADPASEKI